MELLGKLLAIAFVGTLVTLLMRPDSRRIDDITPVRTLKYGWRFRTFVLLSCGGIQGVMIWVALRGGMEDVGEAVAAGVLSLMCIYAFLEVFLVRIFFGADGVTARSPWRGTRHIAWSDFSGYDYSHMNYWHQFKTLGKGTLRLSTYLTGLDSFFEEFVKRRPDVSLTPGSET